MCDVGIYLCISKSLIISQTYFPNVDILTSNIFFLRPSVNHTISILSWNNRHL